MPEIGEIRKACELGSKGSYKYRWTSCEQCGKGRWLRHRNCQQIPDLCRSCAHAQNSGEKNPSWKGGRHKSKEGYVFIKLQPDNFFYSMANGNGYVPEHRLVVAKALGRCLHPWEVVHHKNGIRDDNRYPETLQLVQEMQHKQITIMENRIHFLEQRVTILKTENTLLKLDISMGVK